MANSNLQGVKVAILVTDGFEQVELVEPKKALEDAGAKTVIISPVIGEVQGMHHENLADKFKVDVVLERAQADDYDALLLPGGVGNPDRLRMDPGAIALIKAFVNAGKPVAAICHGPWLLAEADVLRGKTVTSWPSIRTDLRNAGANVVDAEAVTDGQFVTSRKPDDVPAFTAALIAAVEATG